MSTFCPRCDGPTTSTTDLFGEVTERCAAYNPCGWETGQEVSRTVIEHRDGCPDWGRSIDDAICFCPCYERLLETPESERLSVKALILDRSNPFVRDLERGRLAAENWRARLGIPKSLSP